MYSSVQHLARSIFLKENDLMAMVSVYFDDSGTDLKSEIAVAACFISDVRRWTLFEAKWGTILEEVGIKECGFHMTDFVARKPPFDWVQEKRDQTIKSLIGAINQYAFVGVATAVVKSDYDRLVRGKLRDKLGQNHYTFAIQSCLSEIERWRASLNDTQKFDYVFDWMEKGPKKTEIVELFDDLRENNLAMALGIGIDGFGFWDRRSMYPLQAADILAWEASKYIRESQPITPRKSFQSIVQGVNIKTRLWDAECLPAFVEDVSRKYEAVNWDGPLGGFLL